MTKQDRKKASDIFHETPLFFAKKGSFAEAFPQIEDFRIEIKESGSGVEGQYRVQTFTAANPPGEFTDCSNPVCYNGGFRIGSIIRDMVSKGETEHETRGRCQGYEGSAKGKKRYRDCVNFFRIKVSLKYKNEEARKGDDLARSGQVSLSEH